MSLADLIHEPSEYAVAIEVYRLSRLNPKKHLNDDLAEKVLAIAEFGVQELRETISLADELDRHYGEVTHSRSVDGSEE